MQHQQAANSSSNSRNKDAELVVEGTFECDDEDVTVSPKYFGRHSSSNPHFPSTLIYHHITSPVTLTSMRLSFSPPKLYLKWEIHLHNLLEVEFNV